MKHDQQVTFVDASGTTYTDVFFCATGQQAMKECRLKHRGIEVIGAGRVFNEMPGSYDVSPS